MCLSNRHGLTAAKLYSGSPLSCCPAVRRFHACLSIESTFVRRCQVVQRFAAFKLHSGSQCSFLCVYNGEQFAAFRLYKRFAAFRSDSASPLSSCTSGSLLPSCAAVRRFQVEWKAIRRFQVVQAARHFQVVQRFAAFKLYKRFAAFKPFHVY